MGSNLQNTPPINQPSYHDAGLDLFDTLGNAIFLLQQNDDGSAVMAGRISDLQYQQNKVKTDLQLYAAGKITLNPPNQTQINNMMTASKALDTAVDNANLATDFLTLATATVTAWQAAKR